MKTHALAAAVLLTLAIGWLHLVHQFAGHRWFADRGPLLAGALALAGAWAVTVNTGRSGRPRTWQRVAVAAALLVVLVLPEWIEGELSSGHRLASRTLGEHGWPSLGALAAALALVMALEARRVARLITRRQASSSHSRGGRSGSTSTAG